MIKQAIAEYDIWTFSAALGIIAEQHLGPWILLVSALEDGW